MRLLWKEEAVEAVLEFPRDERVGCRPAVMTAMGSLVETMKARRVGRDRPKMHGIFPCLLLLSLILALLLIPFFFLHLVLCFYISFSFSFSFVTLLFVSLFFGFGTLGWDEGAPLGAAVPEGDRSGHIKAHRCCSSRNGAVAMALRPQVARYKIKDYAHTHG